MPGTRTAPDITTTANKTMLSISWVDAENKEYSDNIIIKSTSTAAQREAYVAKAVAASNASAWRVTQSIVWVGARNSSNALPEAHESVADKVRLSYKDLSNDAYQQAYIPAPLTVLVLVGGVVDTANSIYTDWRDAVNAIIPITFIPLNTEFVQNVQRNQIVSP